MKKPFMPDDEQVRLEEALKSAEAASESAQAEVRSQGGITQKVEYDRLSRIVDETSSQVQRSRDELDEYLRKQGGD